jgi:cytochrome c-type biogenesis protein CcmH
MTMRRLLVPALALGLFSAPAAAVQPDEVLPDPGLERRARDISSGLRCLVCQNQSIDDSDAPLAKDLRVLVRERLKAGDSDTAVRDYVVHRYGEFVLLRPVVGGHTLISGSRRRWCLRSEDSVSSPPCAAAYGLSPTRCARAEGFGATSEGA